MTQIVVLDGYTLNPGDLDWSGLEAFGETVVYDRTPEELILERAQHADVLFTNKTPLRKPVLKQLPKLKYIGVLATGFDVVDTEEARKRNIVVTNIPTYGTDSVAQFVFALLLELCHHVGYHNETVKRGEWSSSQDWCYWHKPLVELAGKTMGLIGYGRIGRRTGQIAEAFGMKVIVYDPIAQRSSGDTSTIWVDLEQLLQQSDVVSLHCPLTKDTVNLIDMNRLKLMKRTSLLINTSRGKLINNEDLAEALKLGVIAGAGLDVLEEEPPTEQNKLLTADNCIITPHMAWGTKEARSRLMNIAVENLKAYLSGSPINTV